MNQLPTRIAARYQLKPASHAPGQRPVSLSPPIPFMSFADETAASKAGLAGDVTHGLQLTRASTIALTRLQLALAGGDNRQAMEAIDCLHALDGELEHLVDRLPPREAETGRGTPKDSATLLRKHISDQKLALAFEKLAFASGIVGPDLISSSGRSTPGSPQPQSEQGSRVAKPSSSLAKSSRSDPAHAGQGMDAAQSHESDLPPLVDWHAYPEVRSTILDRFPAHIWAFLAVLGVIVLACVGWSLAAV